MSEGNAAGSALAAKKRALLAQMMKERGLQGSSAQTVPRRGEGSGRPLSFAQQRLWFLDQLEPDSPRYNVFSAYRLQGRVDEAALARSLTELTRRHELLRARFEPRDGQPHQQLRALEPFPLQVEDLRARPAAERETEARRLALAEARRPFDLARGPLLRGTLLTLEDAEHALLLTMHHIVADGWSVGVLGRELWTLYEAFRRGAASPLPEPELQYADFAAWQRATLQGEWLERQLAYWRGRLAGVATLELPTDRPRPAVPGFEGAWQARPLAPGLLDGLKAAGQASGATLYMTLLAGFAAWLSRWSGQADVAVGSPIANRTRAELEGLVGLFANTLVMRVDLSGDPSFRELLARVREVALGAYAHQDVPFERLVEELNPERQLSRSPLFQAALVLDAGSGATAPVRLGELTVSPGGLDNRVSKFDLTLTVVDAEPALLALEYSTELFEPATVARMLEQLERLLAAGLQAPDRPLSALPLLTPGEEHALQAWNQTARDYPVRCVHALFEAQVERTPDAVALAFESATLTYRELDERANRLAHRLRVLGVGPEARVGICMERSLEMVVSLLAVLKAGGAYVPLDPGYPEDRLGFMLADSGVSVLLTQERLAPRLPGHAAAVVAVDAEADALARLPAINRDGGARPDNLAYVIYTSGSTGRPKGAMNQHGAVCNRLLWMQEQYRLGPDDRVLQKTPFSFDVSVWEFFWPLMVGARLVIARPEGHRDAAYLARLMADERITTVHFVPSMLRQFLEEPSAAEAAALRRVICSGEALPHDLQERFFSLMAAELHNLYGPTEAAVDVTCWPCRRGDERHVVPIGRPIANTQAHVLDARLRPVPLGAVGELFLGGVQVGRGYLGRPDLTAERFVPDPCGDRPGARLYRTGDLARWLPDGSVEYLGRVDFQVKVRGFRIELGEVEAALLAHPAVKDAVVAAREDRPGDHRLVAYLVGPAPAGELRRHLLGRLPEYMVPSAFVTLPALPLSPNGKVDRRALPAPGDGGLAPRGGVLRTPSEEALAAIWEGVLRRAPVGPDDNFFELGGHSLLATQVIAQVRKTLGAELPLRAMFEAPTVRALAARVDAARREEPALPAIEPVPRDGPLPLSFAQERLFFLDGLGAGSVYHVPLALRLRGPLDEAALRASLAALVRRHEALRTRIVAEGGRARQVVDDAAGVDLAREDLTGAAGEERETALRSRVADEVARPFDLARAPLMRARLLRLGEDDHALVLTFHHVVSDAWSLGIVLRELAELYRAHRRGEEAALPPLPVQYADYAAWQRRCLTDAALAEHVDYWRRTLSGVSVLDLPTDRPRTGDPGFAGGCEAVAWPPELLASVRELGRREGATLFMALLAAFQAVLQRWAGQDDVAVGTPIAGRTRSETDGVVGLFVNTLVMRTGLGGDPTFRELLARVRTVALEAYDHQDLPFERLVEELRPERDLDLNPLFQVMFALQNAGTGRVALDDLAVSPADLAVRTTHFDLELHAHEQEGGGLLAAVTYRRDLFDAGTVRRLLGHLGTLLAAAAADPGRRLSALPLLAEAEERQRARWNQTAAVVPPDRTVVDLFAAEAGRAPQALAVAAGGATVTYGELEARANRLARRLRAIGVGREVVVAICAERSIEMVLGALAVVKAGGAYLPLDPSYPAERLAYMLEDSRAPVVLAQEQVRATLPPTTARVLALDAEAAAFTHEDPGPLGHAPAADDLAYVIYTSGSTGRPKGVALAHHGLLNLALWHAEAYAVAAADRATQVASPAFDASVWEIWPYLIRGASLHVPSEETRLSAPRLLSWLRDEGITHTFLPTPLAEAVLKEPDVADLPLRWLLTGGDKLHRVQARALPFRLVNHYGPTESTVVATCAEVAPGEPLDPPIGLPIANTCAHVLDARLRPVPAGVRGELYVGGMGLARGYLGRPDLTAERFVPDPLAAEPGARLYRTGDVVRRLADGRLEFLGRADDQVKLRGYRIELGEIESVLGAHPAVGGAAAVLREDDGTRRLVGYVTPRDGQPVPLEHLRSHLRERLPSYMVPSALVVLPALPVSPNGKVDRRALPAPAEPGAGRDSYEAPRTPAETVLARVWAEVLRVDPVGIRDNFFELGGDSILSLQVVARAGEAGLRLSLKQVFQHQTVAELAEVAGTAAEMDAEQGPVAGEAPLTPIQRWYLSPGREAPAHFNQAVLLELRRPVPADVLARAVAAVEAHHDALRMRFEPGASGWTQRLSEPGGEAPFAQVDLSSVAPAQRPAATLAACERAQRSLDLERGPLWRVVRFDRGTDERARLLVVVHHLVVDGVSWRVLLEDLQSACEQGGGQRVRLPRKTTSFKRWAERLAEHARGDAPRREREHWRDTLAGAPHPLPVDDPTGRARNTVGTARTVTVALDEDDTRALLQEVPGAYRTQVADALLAAVLEAFHRWTGADELRLDVEGHGREELFDDVDLSRTVGWFTTVYPVRLRHAAGGPGEALKAVKETLRQVPRHGIGYGLLRHLRGEPLASRAEVAFNYLGQFDQVWNDTSLFGLSGEPSGLSRAEHAAREHLLEINGAVTGGRLRIEWTYSEAVHHRATVERLARGFEAALRELIAHCRSGARGCTPSDFPLARLGPAELARIGADGGDVEDVFPLSPMQEGLLLHTLMAPRSALYFEQARFEFKGPLDVPALRRAWDTVAQRHGALRTRFAWEGLPRVLQVVERRAALPWTEEDWRGLPPPDVDRRFEAWLQADRDRGFAPAEAPLARVAVLRTEEDRHRLVWSFHHALLDGWCLPLVLREVLALYRAYTANEPARLPEVRPFRDYIGWLAEQDLGAAERYWREELAGFEEPTPLGIGEPPAAAGDVEPAEIAFALDEGVTGALQALGRRHGLTLNTLVQGAWAVLLARYSGRDDVLFGVTVSGRPASLRGVDGIVGLFINTLPLRAAVEDDVPALAWLQRLQERQVEQRQYEYSPLADVQRWSGVEPGRALFESLLVFENYPVDPALRESGLALGVRSLGTRETTNYPLTLVAAAAGTRLVVRLLYDPRRFGEHAIAGLQRHLARVLEGLSGAADGRRLGELGLLDASERSALLREAASTEVPYPRDATIAEAFRAQVARDPDAVAASCDGQVLRYGELDQRSNRLARRLRALGVRADARVGVCLRRSLDLPVALLGTLKAGAAYVPLDAAYPAERLAFMLADAGVSVLLTEEGLAASLPHGTHAVVRLDADGGAIAAESAEPFASGATPDTLAYVTYTSGSTGRPKGVEVRHRGVLRLLFGVDYVRLGPDQTLLQLAPVSFDASTLEIWGALLHGGRCALFPGERPTARDLGRAIAAEGVTTLWLTASLFNAVVDEAPEVLAPVRQLLIGGEALSVEHVRRALACLPGTRIVNGYGPTESTTFTCCHEIPRPLGEGVRAIPIGRAIGNTRTYVLDRGLRLVPAGVAGELFIGGDGLARGYLGRPELTAERFVPDPFAARPGERLYRTGDRVRRRPDGTLDFLGRFDHQVKVRGFRIELGEIESALRRHPAVADAVVVVREDRPRDQRVVGYVARRDGAALVPEDLRAELQARLPEYMVPSAFVVLDRLPLGAAGKVDRRALPAPEASLAREPFAPPRDELESAIAAAWREVLGVEEVGIHDSFFDLGGHSLSLLKVHGRLVDVARPHELTIVELFEHPTVASLAAHLRGAGESARRGTAEDRAKRLEEGRSRLGRRLEMRQNAGRPGRPAGAAPEGVEPAPAEAEER